MEVLAKVSVVYVWNKRKRHKIRYYFQSTTVLHGTQGVLYINLELTILLSKYNLEKQISYIEKFAKSSLNFLGEVVSGTKFLQ